MPLEGQQIGRYRLLRLLGSGGMGEVYLAEDSRIGQQVAIKVIRADVSPYPDARATKEAARLFQREAKAIARLDHPHILSLFDYGEEAIGNMTIAYLVMPYRKEGSLADWLRHRNKADLLSVQEVAHIVRQTADALQHAHDNRIIHQDVKPSNFLIRERKETPTHPDLLLSDFGIARLASSASSASQSVRGTPTYMAPEQWDGEPVPATDQYALAVMAYELLTGHPPFQGAPGRMMYQHINVQPTPPSTINPHLSKDVETILLHALAKKPEERFASITAFANAFQQAAQSMQEEKAPLTSSNTAILEEKALAGDTAGSATSAPTPMNESTQTATNSPLENREPMQRTTLDARATGQSRSEATQEETAVVPGGNEILEFPAEKHLAPLTPESEIAVPHHRAKLRSPLLVASLILLTLMLIAGGTAYAMPGVFTGIVKSVFGRPDGTASNRPSATDAATVSIIPASTDLKNTYTILAVTGTPNISRHQVTARLLSTTTQTHTQTVTATGVEKTSGNQATGTLGLENYSNSPMTLNAGQVFSNYSSYMPSVEMVLDVTLTAPPASNGNPGYVTGLGHVLQVGVVGNIPRANTGVCDPKCHGFYYCGLCNGSYDLFNATAFAGGQDPQTYSFVQQSDIDSAANALIQANTPNPQQMLQPQIHSNERLIGTPQCTSNVTSDHRAGDKATSVTVSVNFTCTGEVYDYDGALFLGTKLLVDQAAKDPGAGYVLVGKITTTLKVATLVDAGQGTVRLTVNDEGRWVYQFSDAQKQALAKLLAGKKKADVQALLLEQKGVARVDGIQVSSGDGNTLPADVSRIKIVVERISS